MFSIETLFEGIPEVDIVNAMFRISYNFNRSVRTMCFLCFRTVKFLTQGRSKGFPTFFSTRVEVSIVNLLEETKPVVFETININIELTNHI